VRFEQFETQQEKNDQNGGDPEAGEPGPPGVAGLDADGRCEPVDPEGYPASEDDNVNGMHRRTPQITLWRRSEMVIT
jgi:hypothetical protein